MARVAVIGAGFVGLSSAYWLMRDGHQVALYDPAGVAGGASYGNAGTFANYACIPVNHPSVFRDLPRYLLSGDSPLRLRGSYLPWLMPWLLRFLWHSTPARSVATSAALSTLLARAHEGYRSMVAEAGLAVHQRQAECLYLYAGAQAFRTAEPSLQLRRELGVDCQVIGGDEVARLEPALGLRFDRGVRFEGSWFLADPAAFLRDLHQWLGQRGLHTESRAVTRLRPAADGVLADTASGEAVYDHAVLCAGALSGPLAAQCGDRVPLEAERGYHLMFAGAQGLLSRPVGWAERGFYMTPMAHGLRVAGTVELAGLRPRRDPGLLGLLQFSARRALPALGEPVDPWLGFRPTLPDGLPVIGRSRHSARVLYAFGHQHIGLTLGGLTGALVADLVAQRVPGVDLAPFAASRFV
ncbi:MAG: FAD-binding oxidoreductase [Rhodoferax sp.]|nr:FAD-binding oxidoreductase [Rhodoferax sp.]